MCVVYYSFPLILVMREEKERRYVLRVCNLPFFFVFLFSFALVEDLFVHGGGREGFFSVLARRPCALHVCVFVCASFANHKQLLQRRRASSKSRRRDSKKFTMTYFANVYSTQLFAYQTY